MTFDVSADVDDSTAPDGVDAAGEPPPPAWPRRAARWWRTASRRRRRRAAAIAAGLAVVLSGGVVASAALADHLETQRLRGTPGMVLSLDGDLTETWDTDVDAVAAVLPDGGLAVVAGEEVVAYDVASGSQRWRTGVGADLECGPAPSLGGSVEWSLVQRSVTCVHGPDDARTVAVLDADGAVLGERALDAAVYGGDTVAAVPAADGGLLVVEHDTGVTVPDGLDPADPWSALDTMEVPSRTANLRVEDALTGEVRFTAPDQATRAGTPGSQCVDITFDLSDVEADENGYVVDEGTPYVVELARLRPVSTPTMVAYTSCGIDVATTTEGMSLGNHVGFDGWGSTSRAPFPGGGFVVPDGLGTALVGASGETVTESDDLLLVPQATDGTSGAPYFAMENYEAVVATDAAGTELWRYGSEFADYSLVRTAETVVLGTGERLVGLDPVDGTQRWATTPTGPGGLLSGAVTDGARVAAVTSAYNQASGDTSNALVTVDLQSGAQRQVPLDTEGSRWPVALDGNLVLLELGDPDPADGRMEFAVVGLSVRGAA